MKVLLLGATGSLGSRILPALLAHQHSVVVYIRSEPKLQDIFPTEILSKVTVLRGDAEDGTAIKNALVQYKCEGLVNSAGRIALFPWQAPQMQGIIHAVADAAVDASKELGYPIRAWFLGGTTALDLPETSGIPVKSYFPVLGEHVLTFAYLQTLSQTNLRWSMFCPAAMIPASPERDFSLQSRGNSLIIGVDEVPGWRYGWLHRIPVVGIFCGVVANATGYTTKLEDCADFLAADLAKSNSKYVYHRIGPREVSG